VRDPRTLALSLMPRLDGTHVRTVRVFAIVVAGALLQIVAQTVLARSLPKADVGLVSLVLGAVPLLATLGALGQDSAIVRFAASDRAGRHDLRGYVRRVLLLITPVGLVVGLAANGFYDIAGAAALALLALVVAQNGVTIASSALRGAHRYEVAMAAAWAPAALAAAVLVVLAAVGSLTLHSALGAYVAAYALSAAAILAWKPLRAAKGALPVPGSVLRQGFFFFGLSLSFSVMVAMDRLVIGKLMTYTDVAVYATVFMVMKGFDFLFQAVSFVMMPWVSRVGSVRVARYNAAVVALAVPVAVVYLVLGDDIVHLLYGGRYDQGAFLIAPFVLSGVIKLFYAVPSSLIGGRLPREALRDFLWFSVAAIGFNVVIEVVLIRSMGLMGAAVGTAMAWGVRYVGAVAIVRRHRASLDRPKDREPVDV